MTEREAQDDKEKTQDDKGRAQDDKEKTYDDRGRAQDDREKSSSLKLTR